MAHLVMFLYTAFYIGRIHELFAVLRPLRIVLVLGLLGIVLTLALPPRKRNRLLRLPEVRIVLGLFAVAVVFAPFGVWPGGSLSYIIDTYSRVDLPPVNELRRASDGGMVCKLEEADIAELRESGWEPPETHVGWREEVEVLRLKFKNEAERREREAEGRERITTRAGNYDAVRVTTKMIGGRDSNLYNLRLYITNDERRLPVLISFLSGWWRCHRVRSSGKPDWCSRSTMVLSEARGL